MIVAYAPTVDLLVEAVRTRSSVRFLHRGMERTIDPWHVFLLDGRWYVVGRDHGAEEQRVFAVDAIDALSVGDRTDSFEIPRSDWTRLSEVIRDPDEWTDGDAIDVVIRVDPRILGRAELLLGAEATGKEADDAWVEMTCTVRNVGAFMHRLWGLRARAVVVKPRQIRDAVVEYLHRIV